MAQAKVFSIPAELRDRVQAYKDSEGIPLVEIIRASIDMDMKIDPGVRGSKLSARLGEPWLSKLDVEAQTLGWTRSALLAARLQEYLDRVEMLR